MKLARMVQEKWRGFRENRRKAIRRVAKRHPDGNTRRRAQIIMALVQGKWTADIAEILQCSDSLVQKVAHRFDEQGEAAFADRREDNGKTVVTKGVQNVVWAMVERTPRQFGHRCPTWTLERLVLVLRKQTGVRVSVTTMSCFLRRLN